MKEDSFTKPITSRKCMNKFRMEDHKPVSTPIVTGCKLRKDDESKEVD
jgi:hypothetical protein